MEQKTIEFLAGQAHAEQVRITAELDAALRELDTEMSELAEVLRVEHIGPGVGMRDMQAEHVFRLAVRHHVWNVTEEGWGLKVCDGLPNGSLRPMWPIYGVARLRKQQLIQALPEFFVGLADAVRDAGKDETPAGRRVLSIAAAFA
ncbi:hypothetical protein [Acidihalobacter ferrooxydans]|uniref:Uncharacterized protein n=1 Tax=Acidihalobacter ferrooxydans TaxID=1765967 RepID=A0A1P8UEJ8_9GAMM|nr:hypothetical protein [Acidihalobacter ferrooxydans]APZ42184.1 hypothetical protein BW247_02985 [Acidihalobacter ferrooxydans]